MKTIQLSKLKYKAIRRYVFCLLGKNEKDGHYGVLGCHELGHFYILWLTYMQNMLTIYPINAKQNRVIWSLILVFHLSFPQKGIIIESILTWQRQAANASHHHHCPPSWPQTHSNIPHLDLNLWEPKATQRFHWGKTFSPYLTHNIP